MKKENRIILKKRAQALAKEEEITQSGSRRLDVITFKLGPETYCVESVFVKEVYPVTDYTPLPGVPEHIFGIINVRGRIFPVVDLKKFFNLPPLGLGDLNKIIILENPSMEFGILADQVLGTSKIYENTFEDLPGSISGIGREYIKGITSEKLIILNADRLLNDNNLVVNDKIK